LKAGVEMTDETLNALMRSISKSRLSTYEKQLNSTDRKQQLAYYIWNSKLSENFYFLLQNLEVSLRNAIYNGFQQHFSGEDFFYLHENDVRERYFSKKELHSRECWKMLCGAKHKLEKRCEQVTDGMLIAELNFGFWTEMLASKDANYKQMWRKIFKDVFPNFPGKGPVDTIKLDVSRQIDAIRKFRNRVFHYEPIFNRHNLDYLHEEILVTIGWICPATLEVTKAFDTFEHIKKEKAIIIKQIEQLGVNDEFYRTHTKLGASR
jgi:hypothetical protein